MPELQLRGELGEEGRGAGRAGVEINTRSKHLRRMLEELKEKTWELDTNTRK